MAATVFGVALILFGRFLDDIHGICENNCDVAVSATVLFGVPGVLLIAWALIPRRSR